MIVACTVAPCPATDHVSMAVDWTGEVVFPDPSRMVGAVIRMELSTHGLGPVEIPWTQWLVVDTPGVVTSNPNIGASFPSTTFLNGPETRTVLFDADVPVNQFFDVEVQF